MQHSQDEILSPLLEQEHSFEQEATTPRRSGRTLRLAATSATRFFGMSDSENDQGEDSAAAAAAPVVILAHHEAVPWYRQPIQIIAMLSNCSTSYNVVNIAMALPIFDVLYSSTSEQIAGCASSLLAGMIVGQVLGGILGDWPALGRLGALRLVMLLQISASLFSASLDTNNVPTFFRMLAMTRFFLGVGAGGVYPLAAVMSAETTTKEKDDEEGETSPAEAEEEAQAQTHRVVLTFSMQGVGFVAAPLITLPLLYITDNLEMVWRLVLAAGSLPGMVLMILQWWVYGRTYSRRRQLPTLDDMDDDSLPTNIEAPAMHDPDGQPQPRQQQLQQDERLVLQDVQIMEEQLRVRPGLWASIRHEPDLVRKLLGTAVTWYLFDILFYGNTLFEPIVIAKAFGTDKLLGAVGMMYELRQTILHSLYLTLIALPGYAVAGFVMGKKAFCCWEQSPKIVMLQGFAAMAALYLVIGLCWSSLEHHRTLLLLIYGLTFFFANYGPNTTTFILPSLVFSPECRTTLNGISAAAGKLGALTGATLFDPVSESIGHDKVMLICSAVSVLAFIMTARYTQTINKPPQPDGPTALPTEDDDPMI